jgi:hypothetical protein
MTEIELRNLYLPIFNQYEHRMSGEPAQLNCKQCDGLALHKFFGAKTTGHEQWKCAVCGDLRIWGVR